MVRLWAAGSPWYSPEEEARLRETAGKFKSVVPSSADLEMLRLAPLYPSPRVYPLFWAWWIISMYPSSPVEFNSFHLEIFPAVFLSHGFGDCDQ